MVDYRYRVNAGSVFSLKYHLVWCPKYRKPILVNALEKRLRELLHRKAKEIKAEIHALEIMPDPRSHVRGERPNDGTSTIGCTVQGIHEPPTPGRISVAQVVSAESVVSELLHRQHRGGLESNS
jgi:hypothetical protein